MADFNGDGLQDFLFNSADESSLLSFDLQNREWATTTLPEDVRSNYDYTIEDYDSDGDLDLVYEACIYQFELGRSCSIGAHVNNGNGQFVQETIKEGINVPQHDGAIDLDADGTEELVVLEERLAVYRFEGDGWSLISETQSHPDYDNTQISNLSLEDVNQDGFADLIVTQEGSHGQYFIGQGSGDLQFDPLVQIPGDRFSGDGLVYGEHRRVFSSWTEIDGRRDWESVAVPANGEFIDLDGDGDQDFVVPSRNGVTIMYQIEPGDFDNDGESTAKDLELLYANLGSLTSSAIDTYDLNHDYTIDQQDVDFWIIKSAKTRLGDANLDGTVDFVDFLALAGSFGKVDTELRWGDGDFNGDGMVNFIDFLALAENFGRGN